MREGRCGIPVKKRNIGLGIRTQTHEFQEITLFRVSLDRIAWSGTWLDEE